jgi:hypothetical protein
MEVIILLHFREGLGDCYSSILTGFYTKKQLEKLGLSVSFEILSNNLYIKNYDKMWYELFDFTEIGETPNIVSGERYLEIKDKYKELEKDRNVLEIFYSKDAEDIIKSYKHKNYDVNEPYNLKTITYTPKLINKDLLDTTHKKYSKYKDYVCIHIRTGDSSLNSEINSLRGKRFFDEKFNEIESLISEDNNIYYYILSDNNKVRKYFTDKYDNCSSDIFEDGVILHQIKSSNYDTMEIVKTNVIEMCGMSYFKDIITIGTWKSNFTLYGRINTP